MSMRIIAGWVLIVLLFAAAVGAMFALIARDAGTRVAAAIVGVSVAVTAAVAGVALLAGWLIEGHL